MRLGLLLVLALSACKTRDPNAWPQSDLDTFRAKCPDIAGDEKVCDCFTAEVARRVPFGRMQTWKLELSPKFEKEIIQLEESLTFCAGDAGVAPYSPLMRKRVMDGCLTGATAVQCKCILRVYEANLPITRVNLLGLRAKRGDTQASAEIVKPVKDEMFRCFAADTDAPWTESATQRLERGCLDEGATKAFCACYVEKSKKLIKYRDLARAGTDPEAAKLLEDNFAIAALACAEEQELKPPQKSR